MFFGGNFNYSVKVERDFVHQQRRVSENSGSHQPERRLVYGLTSR